MNPDDAARLHLKHGDRVVLSNQTGRFEGTTFLCPIAPGNLQVHWPEGNVLIPGGIRDAAGGVPDYNATVEVARASRP
jgi:anaerobic selenocysteine-containing dehydrogenase